MHCLKKKCHGVPEMQKYAIGETECNEIEVFILGGQRNDQKRNKGWWRGSRERIEMEEERG